MYSCFACDSTIAVAAVVVVVDDDLALVGRSRALDKERTRSIPYQ